MGEMKPKSLRIEDETFEKFKSISAEIGGNQQETLELLINNYELQKGKENLVARKEEIEQFERYIHALLHMFMCTLEDNQNMKDTVRTEFDAMLKSKDTIIQDLQKKIESYKLDAEESKKNEAIYKNEVSQLQEEISNSKKAYQAKIDNLQDLLSSKDSTLSEKESMNTILADNVKDLKKQIESISAEQGEMKELSEKIENLVAKNKALEEEKQRLQFEHEKEVFSLEKEYNSKIETLKGQQATEINSYQAEYKKLLLELKVEQQQAESKKEVSAQLPKTEEVKSNRKTTRTTKKKEPTEESNNEITKQE